MQNKCQKMKKFSHFLSNNKKLVTKQSLRNTLRRPAGRAQQKPSKVLCAYFEKSYFVSDPLYLLIRKKLHKKVYVVVIHILYMLLFFAYFKLQVYNIYVYYHWYYFTGYGNIQYSQSLIFYKRFREERIIENRIPLSSNTKKVVGFSFSLVLSVLFLLLFILFRRCFDREATKTI